MTPSEEMMFHACGRWITGSNRRTKTPKTNLVVAQVRKQWTKMHIKFKFLIASRRQLCKKRIAAEKPRFHVFEFDKRVRGQTSNFRAASRRPLLDLIIKITITLKWARLKRKWAKGWRVGSWWVMMSTGRARRDMRPVNWIRLCCYPNSPASCGHLDGVRT